jgi:DNA-binding transcriptional MerR regulator
MRDQVVGRSGLAKILGVSEGTTRNLERRGEIAPEAIVDGRALFSAEKARLLRAARDARRGGIESAA